MWSYIGSGEEIGIIEIKICILSGILMTLGQNTLTSYFWTAAYRAVDPMRTAGTSSSGHRPHCHDWKAWRCASSQTDYLRAQWNRPHHLGQACWQLSSETQQQICHWSQLETIYVKSSRKTRLMKGQKNRLWSDTAGSTQRLIRAWTFCFISCTSYT